MRGAPRRGLASDGRSSASVGALSAWSVDRGGAAALGVRQVADDDGELAQPLPRRASRGQVDHRLLAGPGERLAQHEVLGRVAGQGHLGEDHQVRAGVGGRRATTGSPARLLPGQVTDARVDLGEGHPQLHAHTTSLIAVRMR